MTLKEKFFEVYLKYYKKSNELDKMAEVADDYAIEFADWKEKFVCQHCGGNGYTVEVEAECCRQRSDYCCGIPNPVQVQIGCYCNNLSTKEVLEIFKKEKGL
ncbi:hypothetical protein [Flavobacterium sp.]|uniref:hypothetical protein n=1 Tax=Flavobacterium sp. TaxID=239 RepID=UPI0025D4471F|nr:hypothetical protein [Flavobacterium sp.]